jgi:hypothetical protein
MNPDTEYPVLWYDTYAGAAISTETVTSDGSGDLVLSIDSLTDDIAVMLNDEPASAVRLTAPVARPAAFGVGRFCPNPLHRAAAISYRLPVEGQVKLSVYDTDGRLVRTVVSRREKPGVYRVIWDGTDSGGGKVAAGTYVCRFAAGRYVQIRRLTVVRR